MTRLAASFRVRGAALLAAACLLSAAPAAAQHQHTAGGAAGVPELGASRTEPWDGDVLQLAATLPVQDGGRVKPLSTKAGFLLLRMNGKRSVKTPDGERLGPTAWLLDSLLFPQQAAGYPVFLIQNDAVLDAIGIAHEGKGKRDRYAYSDLQPGRRKLYDLAREYSRTEQKDRSPVEQQLIDLAHNVYDFEGLGMVFDFARIPLSLGGSEAVASAFQDPKRARLTELLAAADRVEARLGEARAAAGPGTGDEARTLEFALRQGRELGSRGDALALLPPAGDATAAPEWVSVDGAVGAVLDHQPNAAGFLTQLTLLEALERTKATAGFKDALQRFHDATAERATARGEYGVIPLEVTFYKGDFFYRSLLLYGLAFLVLAGSWMRPKSVWLPRIAVGTVGLATVLATVGIVLRCIIRGRPPVTTLYETILFVTVVGVLVALFLEWVNRQGVGLALATLVGLAGLFLAGKYELKEAASAGDTMGAMVAVLDTNFWLATHVTTISMGYAAGLLASAMAHVWLFGKMFGAKRGDVRFYSSLTRTTYGVLCFAVTFSVIGTILGGIWANYSWGRFWGWDPKENGALLIVLWQLTQLHAKRDHLIGDLGFAVASVLGGLVVVFSWWGVNLLGVGLHSYGFTSGVFQGILALFVIEGLILVAAGGWSWVQARAEAAAAAERGAFTGN